MSPDSPQHVAELSPFTTLSEPTLSERQRRFVEAYMGAAAGDADKAARLAGYAKSTARKQASRLLAKVGIRRAIEARVQADPAIADTTRLQRFLTAIVEGRGWYITANLRDRLKAAELLGRSHGMFSHKVQLEAGNSLADILERAERLRLRLPPKDQGDGQAHHG